MQPRITISRSKDGELEIWLNPTGRDLLVRELQHLNERNDHFHLMPDDMPGEVPTRGRAYREGDQVFQWGKVLFRPDDWDARYYPHVLDKAE
jgi:hypothetical protein